MAVPCKVSISLDVRRDLLLSDGRISEICRNLLKSLCTWAKMASTDSAPEGLAVGTVSAATAVYY